VSRFLTGHQQN